jgi:hypothetical protein
MAQCWVLGEAARNGAEAENAAGPSHHLAGRLVGRARPQEVSL